MSPGQMLTGQISPERLASVKVLSILGRHGKSSFLSASQISGWKRPQIHVSPIHTKVT